MRSERRSYTANMREQDQPSRAPYLRFDPPRPQAPLLVADPPPATPPAEPTKPYYPQPPPTKPEPLPEAKRLTAPGTALGEADKKNGNVAEWYLTNFRVRFAREDGSWFDPDIEDSGGTPCPGCTADEKAP